MEFFLDIDGVILDFETSFIDFIRHEYLPDLPQDYVPTSWEVVDEFNGLDIVEVFNKFNRSSGFSRLKPLVNVESFNRISRQYPVYLVTNLTDAQFSDRKKNLALHQLNYKEIHLAGHFDFGIENYPTKSATIAKLHQKGERLIFLDDHPRNCEDVKENLPEAEVYLMSRPHNRNKKNRDWIRVENWDGFVGKVFNSGV